MANLQEEALLFVAVFLVAAIILTIVGGPLTTALLRAAQVGGIVLGLKQLAEEQTPEAFGWFLIQITF